MNSPSEISTAQRHQRTSGFIRFLRVFFNRTIVIFGFILILAFLFCAAFANIIAPYDPNYQDLNASCEPPSSQHILGTDNLGRDTLSRIIYGSRITLAVGVIALGIAALLGMSLGLLAGYLGGWTYTIIMRLMDTLMAFPMLVLAMVISTLLGGGLVNVMIALGISLTPGYARLMCNLVLTNKENDYVLAERCIGSGNLRIMLRHLLPNCIPTFIVMITMMMGITILAEAGLSFIGIGIQAPEASWGSMISDGYQYLLKNPVLSIAPGIAIMLVVFGFNMVGDGLRDALDPKLRGSV